MPEPEGTPGVAGQEPQGDTGTQTGDGQPQPTSDTGGDLSTDVREEIKKVRNASMKRIADVEKTLGGRLDRLIELQLAQQGQGGQPADPQSSGELDMDELGKLAQKNPVMAMAKMAEHFTQQSEQRLVQQFQEQQTKTRMTDATMKIEGHLASRYPELADETSDFFVATQEEFSRRLREWGVDAPGKGTPARYFLVEASAAAVKDRLGAKQALARGKQTAQELAQGATNIPEGSGEAGGERKGDVTITDEDMTLGRKLGFKMEDPEIQKVFLANKSLVIPEGEEE